MTTAKTKKGINL